MRRAAAASAALLFWLISGAVLPAQTLRLATFNTELSRKGPGLLLRDLLRDTDPQITEVLATIVTADADILALQSIDWDHDGQALEALQQRLAEAGMPYPYSFTRRPNAGVASGLDLDGDDRLGEPEDAWGWGRFTGQSGLALLSRHPIVEADAIDLTDIRWHTLPHHRMPRTQDGQPYPNADIAQVLRLSSVSHWAVPIQVATGSRLWVMTFHAAPPVFDGPEDRNGRRNADEILLWQHFLDGALGETYGPVPQPPFVLLGDANNDPLRGEGHKDALLQLLNDPRLSAPVPQDETGASHTVVWDSTGPMRVDYILPSSELTVVGSGILRSAGSRHGLVWVDIQR